MAAPLDARTRLADAHLYLCTDARQRQGDLEQFLDAALAGGVDIVQLRQKDLEARQELACLEVVADVAARHGTLVAVNDRADIARAFGADVLHLGQDDLPVDTARVQVGSHMLLGLSTHTRHQVETAAAQPTIDYFCVGPTWPTPTKPGRSAPGLNLTEYTAGLTTTRPWFAIGGIDLDTVELVRAAGARRAVVVRAITEATDPGGAAAELARRLRQS